MKRKPINQQVVAVVGSASGIGRETALQFAARGARLVVADNDEQGLTTLMQELQRRGAMVTAVVADVADFAQVQAIADRAVERYGRLDTWVHVAAVSVYATVEQTTAEEYQRVIDVDLMGQIYGAKAALPHLLRQGSGGLIHVSSVIARRAFPYQSAYSAAKHGLDGFLEALRVELWHQKASISVTQILPSSINTPFFDHAKTKIGVKPIGTPPLYSPSTVAHAILHAAEHPRREIIVGGAGKLLVTTQRLSPRLNDALFFLAGFRGQKTNQPRREDAPNNLFGPARQNNRVEGDFGSLSFSHSLSTWLDLHPMVKVAATLGTALGVGALIGQRSGGEPVGLRRTPASRTIVDESRLPAGIQREYQPAAGGATTGAREYQQ